MYQLNPSIEAVLGDSAFDAYNIIEFIVKM